MRISERNPNHDDAFKDRPDLKQVLQFSPLEPIAAPQVQHTTSTPSAPQLNPIMRKAKKR